MARRVGITTIDNPYHPLREFDAWFEFDSMKNYNSCSVLARFVISSHELSDADQTLAIEDAIDRIVALDLPEKYRKVVVDD